MKHAECKHMQVKTGKSRFARTQCPTAVLAEEWKVASLANFVRIEKAYAVRNKQVNVSATLSVVHAGSFPWYACNSPLKPYQCSKEA